VQLIPDISSVAFSVKGVLGVTSVVVVETYFGLPIVSVVTGGMTAFARSVSAGTIEKHKRQITIIDNVFFIFTFSPLPYGYSSFILKLYGMLFYNIKTSHC
jgi:hypothetical protein